MVADPAVVCAIDPELRRRICSSTYKLPGLLVKGHSDIGPACALLLLYQALGPFLSDDEAARLLGCSKKAVRTARRFLADSEVIAPERVGLRWIKRIVFWPRRSSGLGDITVRIPGAVLLDLIDGVIDVTDLRVLALVAMDRIFVEDAEPACCYSNAEIALILTKAPVAVRRSLDRLEQVGWLLRLPGARNRSRWIPSGFPAHTQPRTPAVTLVARGRGLLPNPARKGTPRARRDATKLQVTPDSSRTRTHARGYSKQLKKKVESEAVDSLSRLASRGKRALAERIARRAGVSLLPAGSG